MEYIIQYNKYKEGSLLVRSIDRSAVIFKLPNTHNYHFNNKRTIGMDKGVMALMFLNKLYDI